MNCPICGVEADLSNKFCKRCGASLETGQPPTRIMPVSGLPDTIPIEPDTKNSTNKAQEKKGPNLDLVEVRKASLVCALLLGLSTVAVHFLATYLVKLFGVRNIEPSQSLNSSDPTNFFIQAVMSGTFLLFLLTPLGIPRKGKLKWDKLARDSFHQFFKGWTSIWVTWFLLYLYLGVVMLKLKPWSIEDNAAVQVTVDFLNVANSVAFFFVFLVLDMPSVPSDEDRNRDKRFRKVYIIVILICFAVFLFSCSGRFDGAYRIGIFLSGIVVAISMAYVFGRLDSHHMDVNRLVLAPLYLYAVIQVIGPPLIGLGATIQYQNEFFATALVLKIYLFLVISIWLQDGTFERYFTNASPKKRVVSV